MPLDPVPVLTPLTVVDDQAKPTRWQIVFQQSPSWTLWLNNLRKRFNVLDSVTFKGLPTNPTTGQMLWITDSPTNTFGATIAAGGGTFKGMAVWDGTQWTFR